MDHARDPKTRIRYNSVNALAVLQPGIPDDVLQFLVQLMDDPDDRVSIGALHGVLRMSGSNPSAADAVEKALSRSDPRNSRLTIIKVVGESHIDAPRVCIKLGGLLKDPDANVVGASLMAINRLGKPAIRI